MHSKAQVHSSSFHMNWNPANVALVILITLLFLVFLFLFLNLTAQPAMAQNSVPPTALQAARMPQFAAKLAHGASRVPSPAQPHASYKNPNALAQGHRGPLDDNTLYENGPINGTTDAWSINYGFVVADTFTATAASGSTISGLGFGAWLFPGDMLQSVEVSITSAPFGGTTYFDGVVNLTQSSCSGNQYGYNVCTETGSFTLNNLNAGTYWVNLQNAVVNSGNPVFWDENSGAGCQSQGCPSQADQTSTGTIPSEAFSIEGSSGPPPYCNSTCPPGCAHDTDNFSIIHNFNQNEQPSAPGLAIDQSGKVYGLIQAGFGNAYQLALHGGSWIFNSLYSFLGGANGQSPGAEVVGPEGALYGIADGGFQTCGSSGSQYCGLIYRLRPSPSVCLTALCNWSEDAVYEFRGDPDGWAPDSKLVLDEAGNMYGTTFYGGAYGLGTVYQLTRSGGAWTEHVIYSFTGGSDGSAPGQLLLGHDGDLYGTSTAGFFRLIRSGGNWSLTVLTYLPDNCSGFVQDGSGNFYCFDTFVFDQYNSWGEIWELSYGNWTWSLIEQGTNYYYACNFDICYDVFRSLAVDSAGQVYVTAGGYYHMFYYECPDGYVFTCDGNIHKAGIPSDRLVDFNGDVFNDLQVGSNGNFYGTNQACGSSSGAVWQLTP